MSVGGLVFERKEWTRPLVMHIADGPHIGEAVLSCRRCRTPGRACSSVGCVHVAAASTAMLRITENSRSRFPSYPRTCEFASLSNFAMRALPGIGDEYVSGGIPATSVGRENRSSAPRAVVFRLTAGTLTFSAFRRQH